MAKYIKDFDTTAEMQAYYQTAPGKAYYLLKDKSGSEGIGTSLTSGKQIVSLYKSQHDYLTFTAVDAGATVIYNALANTTAEYSTDGGINWQDAVGVTVTLANVGDSVKYRGVISGNISAYSSRFAMTGRIAASGSIMSMYNNNPDDTTITYEGAFRSMFKDCTSLTTAPELPATTLATSCYGNMFQRCTSLTTAPELPATTLATYCYYEMFGGCTSLTVAPELPATTLASSCYNYMFSNCTSLTSVTHHITNWNTVNTNSWLSGVAATGTVICPAASTIPSNNASGIPTGWTRVDL